MKVFIGDYVSWWGPYQIADLLKHVGVSEDRCYEIGKWLADTWVNAACCWIHAKKKRDVRVEIKPHDVYSLDDTLAYIILPSLKLLKERKQGAPFVEDDDVPDELKSTSSPKKEHEWDTDENWFKRWDYVMDQMIWAFEQIHGDSDWEAQYHADGFDYEGHQNHQARINNGMRLFGKYYQALWY